MIRTFHGKTADQAWQHIRRAFTDEQPATWQPGRGARTKEFLHTITTIEDSRQRWTVSREPAMNPAFALAEVIWIMRGRSDVAFLECFFSGIRRFVGPGDILPGAYGQRLIHNLGIDQLDRAYHALRNNPTSRQVVLQIWDGSIDMPNSDGSPTSEDVPCNVVCFLKIRDGRLHWMQVMRSNDCLRGITNNIVQFSSLQEVMAGWLEIEMGPYIHISDSLHVYEKDLKHVLTSQPVEEEANIDDLRVDKLRSDKLFCELERKTEQLIAAERTDSRFERVIEWRSAPPAYRNILAILGAELARRKGNASLANRLAMSCNNPILSQCWQRWLSRMEKASET